MTDQKFKAQKNNRNVNLCTKSTPTAPTGYSMWTAQRKMPNHWSGVYPFICRPCSFTTRREKRSRGRNKEPKNCGIEKHRYGIG